MSHVHSWHGRVCAEGIASAWASHCLARAVPGGKAWEGECIFLGARAV